VRAIESLAAQPLQSDYPDVAAQQPFQQALRSDAVTEDGVDRRVASDPKLVRRIGPDVADGSNTSTSLWAMDIDPVMVATMKIN
jgi:hypothetical protein